MTSDTFAATYLIATVLFIFGLKGLSSPRTALFGNAAAMCGMALAIGATLFDPSIQNYSWILGGIALGALIGVPLALKIPMTAMPELVAILHSFVGLAAVLVAIGTYWIRKESSHLDTAFMIELAAGSAIGALTFTGSLVAFGKLQGMLGSSPITFRGQHFVNATIALLALAFGADFVIHDHAATLLVMTCLAFVLGTLMIIPIGGADMPVIVSMLNSYSGWAAAATGFTLHNNLLITTGALVGSSGAILSYIMCRAMNRSFTSVILGGFGGDSETTASDSPSLLGVRSASVEDLAFMLENANHVIIIPGYGMAVAQAQHAIRECFDLLRHRGIEVKFAIHPVAGRMPGHMNVLLAESEIPYESVQEMEEINHEFTAADVVLVIGANDVVNPDAKNKKASPLFGMPILDAYKSKQVFVLKRSMKPGYAGVDNALFYYPNCSLVFGDAKETCERLAGSLQESA